MPQPDAEFEIPSIDQWRIQTSQYSSVRRREFVAKPVERLVLEYKTVERYLGRLIDATYPAEIDEVHVSHHWDEEQQNWRSHIRTRLFLLNPKTLKRYSLGNWKGEAVQPREGTFPAEAEILRVISAVTEPTVKIIITVTEEPLNA